MQSVVYRWQWDIGSQVTAGRSGVMTRHAEERVISRTDASLMKNTATCPVTYRDDPAAKRSSPGMSLTGQDHRLTTADISAPEGFPKGYDWEALAEFDDLQSHS
jgi:hypothetical protein